MKKKKVPNWSIQNTPDKFYAVIREQLAKTDVSDMQIMKLTLPKSKIVHGYMAEYGERFLKIELIATANDASALFVQIARDNATRDGKMIEHEFVLSPETSLAMMCLFNEIFNSVTEES